jgi:hypothetical protein
MDKGSTQQSSECNIEAHSQHLCYIISQGFHLSDEQEYKTLIENAEYKCSHCGRAAKSDTNLCIPAHL